MFQDQHFQFPGMRMIFLGRVLTTEGSKIYPKSLHYIFQAKYFQFPGMGMILWGKWADDTVCNLWAKVSAKLAQSYTIYKILRIFHFHGQF